MREIRPSGLEGGETQLNASSLPLSWWGTFEERRVLLKGDDPLGQSRAWMLEEWVAGRTLGDFEKRFDGSEILFRRDLEIGLWRLNDRYGIARHLGNLRVVCRVTLGVRIRLLDPIETKDLRRLRLPQPFARDGFSDLMLSIRAFHGSSDRRSENRSSLLVRGFDHLIEKSLGQARSSSVMNRD